MPRWFVLHQKACHSESKHRIAEMLEPEGGDNVRLSSVIAGRRWRGCSILFVVQAGIVRGILENLRGARKVAAMRENAQAEIFSLDLWKRREAACVRAEIGPVQDGLAGDCACVVGIGGSHALEDGHLRRWRDSASERRCSLGIKLRLNIESPRQFAPARSELESESARLHRAEEGPGHRWSGGRQLHGGA